MRLAKRSSWLLRHAYEGAPDGFHISDADRLRVNASGGVGAAAYGELSASGGSVLLHALGLDESSVFCDLGSGRGALVMQAALESRASLCIGVELSAERHAVAARALARLQAHQPDAIRARLVCADLRTASLDGVTAVFVANLLFPPPLDAAVSRRLAACTELRRVATLKPLPVLPGLTFKCRLKLPFTWAERCSVFVYQHTSKTSEAWS